MADYNGSVTGHKLNVTKYLHYIMTIAFMAAGIISKEMWMFLPVVLYNMLCFYSPVYIGGGGIIVACEAPAFREYYGLEKEMLIVAGLAAAVLLYGRTRRLNESGSVEKAGHRSISGHTERTESYRQRDP